MESKAEKAQRMLEEAAIEGDALRISHALKAGASARISARKGTPLILAAAHARSPEAIEALAKAGADPNAAFEGHWTALMQAASGAGADVVSALLRAGADPERRSRGGETALMIAAIRGNAEAAWVLLEAGADWAAKNPFGQIAEDMAGRIPPNGIEERLRAIRIASEQAQALEASSKAAPERSPGAKGPGL